MTHKLAWAEVLEGYLRRDPDGVAGGGGPPDHQVEVDGDPEDASDEGHREVFSLWNKTQKWQFSASTFE